MSVVAAVLIYRFAPPISVYTLDEQRFIDVLTVGAIIIPFNTLTNITYSVFKAIDRIDYNVIVSSIINPLLRLIFLSSAIALGFSIVGVIAALVVSGILTFIVAVLVLLRKTSLSRVIIPNRSQTKEYYNFSVPVTFNQFGNFLYNRVDLLIVGIFLSGSAVGVYNVAVILSGVLTFLWSRSTSCFLLSYRNCTTTINGKSSKMYTVP